MEGGTKRKRIATGSRLAALQGYWHLGGTVPGLSWWRAASAPPIEAPSVPMPRQPRSIKVILQIGAVAFWILAATQLLVWSRLRVTQAGYELSAAREMIVKLEEQQRALQIEAALLSNPASIEKAARERLGMRPPRPGETIGIK